MPSLAKDFDKLRHVLKTVTPGLIFAPDAMRYGRALEAVVPMGTEVVLCEGALSDRTHTPYQALCETPDTAAVDVAIEATGPDTIVKFLFTSGSTKMPKAVYQHAAHVCCANQQANGAVYASASQPTP